MITQDQYLREFRKIVRRGLPSYTVGEAIVIMQGGKKIVIPRPPASSAGGSVRL